MCFHSSFWKEGGMGADVQTAGPRPQSPTGWVATFPAWVQTRSSPFCQQLFHRFVVVLKSLQTCKRFICQSQAWGTVVSSVTFRAHRRPPWIACCMKPFALG